MSADPSPLTRQVAAHLMQLLEGEPSAKKLNSALRFLAKWRSQLVENTLVARSGETILAGPFAGMAYPVRASEGARIARLLGAYEASLRPVIETIVETAYPLVIDVGSAEGYYAVGLALRMPGSRVMARDTDPEALRRCAELARANGVEARVETGGRLTHAELDVCRTVRTVILCDIEGAERDLLDPARAPGLVHADVLVEVHEGMDPGLLGTLEDRFALTHEIRRIGRALDPAALPPWMEALSDMDRLLALWEWRASPTPWLWMTAREPPGA